MELTRNFMSDGNNPLLETMKREIKFRAWDNHLEVMHCDIQLLDTFNEYLSKDKFNCLQYTGLKDKNGKEIYGDYLIEKYGEVFQVKQLESGEWIGDNSEMKKGILSYHELKDSEIIGNIYENPELL